jgi:hypothetical protein
MTGKADFTEEEWTQLRQAPTSAGMLVMESHRGGIFRESFSMAKAYTEARKEHGSSQLLDDLVSEKPEVDRTRFGSPEEMRSSLLQHIRDAVGVMQQKATPEELDEYRRFVLALSNRVAEAHREGGEQVSQEEREAVDEIQRALG